MAHTCHNILRIFTWSEPQSLHSDSGSLRRIWCIPTDHCHSVMPYAYSNKLRHKFVARLACGCIVTVLLSVWT